MHSLPSLESISSSQLVPLRPYGSANEVGGQRALAGGEEGWLHCGLLPLLLLLVETRAFLVLMKERAPSRREKRDPSPPEMEGVQTS